MNRPLAVLIAALVSLPLRAAGDPDKSPYFWAGGLTLAALLTDRSIHREVTIRQHGTINNILGDGRYGRSGTVAEMMGEPYTTVGISAVFWGAGTWSESVRARRVGKAGIEAALWTSLATLGVKWTVGRNRPYAGNDSDEYHPFRGSTTARSSFPSGHASISFAMAAVVADEYPQFAVDAIAYGAAGAVALSRVYQDRHWASDVVAGAALGIGIGKWTRRRVARGDGVTTWTDGRRVYLARRF